MIHFQQLFALLLLALFSFNCTSSIAEAEVPENAPLIFFDLKSYINQEVDRLRNEKTQVQKQIELGDKKESIQPKEIDFQQELAIFLNSDINKLAWQEKYQADSTVQNGQLTRIHYQAIDTTLRTKLLSIDYMDGDVDQIVIENSTQSIVAKTHQKLIYQPKKGYSINNEQKTLFSKKQQLKLEVEFL